MEETADIRGRGEGGSGVNRSRGDGILEGKIPLVSYIDKKKKGTGLTLNASRKELPYLGGAGKGIRLPKNCCRGEW